MRRLRQAEWNMQDRVKSISHKQRKANHYYGKFGLRALEAVVWTGLLILGIIMVFR